MDERSSSPEIDVVGIGDNSEMFHARSGRLYVKSTNSANNTNTLASRSANENGANPLAANTNSERNKSETVNLRVRNMGFITVKKEPESDEDNESSYSLSSLIEECDFDKTWSGRALKSPTSLALAKAKSLESARPVAPSQGRPRQSLENVISSLKSARAMNDNQPLPISRSVSVPPRIVSAATPAPVFASPGGPLTGIGPQIVDVRSLASVARPPVGQSKQIRGMNPAEYLKLGRPLNAGHPRRCTANLAASVPNTPATFAQSSTIAQTTVVSGTQPVNIRFVLPANVPFSTEQFQQVLQATLASLSSQSKVIDPSQLQQAIQAALTSVTKSTVAFNSEQLQQAIKNSLTVVTDSTPVSQVTSATLSPAAVYWPRATQRQPQPIAPKPPSLPLQPTVMRVETSYGGNNIPSFGNVAEKQTSLSASVASLAPVTQNSNLLPVVNNVNNNQSTSESLSSSNLSSARDALVKALQKNQILNSPISSTISPRSASLTSAAVVVPSANNTDSFDLDSYSPPSSPLLPADDSSKTTSSSSSSLTASVPQTTKVTDSSSPPTTVPDSQMCLAQKVSPMPYGAKSNFSAKSGEKSPEQSNGQKSIITQIHVNPASTPVVLSKADTVNRPNPTHVPSAAPLSGSNTTSVNLQISVPINVANAPVSINSDKKPTEKDNKPAPTGCGCCSNCKNKPEPDKDTYTCHFAGCGFIYSTLQGLRKHHYFNPSHRPQVPLEKAANSVDHFLPSELTNCHRTARLRELLKRLTNEELKELFLPRVAKTVSLFDLLELKSVRSNISRGQASVSAFKMYGEFERFRKEAESRLMELILLPQGKGGFKNEKNEVKKDAPSVNTAQTDGKQEGSSKQLHTVSDSSFSSTSSTKKIPETIVIDGEDKITSVAPVSELQKSGTSAVHEPSPCQRDISNAVSSGAIEGEGKTKDPSSVEKKVNDLNKGSSKKQLVDESKQSDASEESLEEGKEVINLETLDAKPSGGQPLESEQIPETEGGVTATKESTLEPMETDKVQRTKLSATESEKQKSSSTDVIMLDAADKTEPLRIESDLHSRGDDEVKASRGPADQKIEADASVLNADGIKLIAATEKESESLVTGGEEKIEEQSSKPGIPVDEESKGEAIAAEKNSVVEKEKGVGDGNDKAIDHAKDYGNNSNTGSDMCETGNVKVVAESADEKTVRSGKEKAEQVSVSTDGNGKGNGNAVEAVKGCKDTDRENSVQHSGGKQTSMALKSSDKTEESKNEQSTTRKQCQESDVEVVEEKPSSSVEVPSSSVVHTTDDVTSNSADMQKEECDTPLCTELKQKLIAYSIDDDEGINESNLLEFGLPFAVKWGKVIKKIETLEARKIARKENYTEQDMKQFIYGKPKDAATAVINSDCHAHPSFFRAYVMPALLDRHIDDFGIFGRKILSGLNLSRKKYVDVLRTRIGPELAKIFGINIFPTFKRIMDTWQMVKDLPPGGTVKTPLVLIHRREDGREVADDEDEGPPVISAATSRTVTNVQTSVARVSDTLKRSSTPDSEPNGNNKRPRLENPDAPKDTSQANKIQNDSSARRVADPCNVPDKGQKPDSTDSSTPGKVVQQQDDKNQSAVPRNNKVQNEQPATDKPRETGSGDSGKGSSSSAKAPQKEPAVSSTSAGATVSSSPSKPTTNLNPALIIPKKATIYTSDTSKGGASPLPLATAKGSPLYLVPAEKLAPKLIEQFINQAKGDGIKTRSASSTKKSKQPKQGSQVFVLTPPSDPSGSPIIQALNSEEQLKSSGDKKPLLLLPADKVPKTMASQSPTVRRKMLITVMSSRESTSSTQSSGKKSLTTTNTSSAADQQKPDSAVQSITSPIMSTKESNVNTTAAEPSKEATTEDPPPEEGESKDSSVKSLMSVVSNTSALSSTSNDSSEESTTGNSSSGAEEVNQNKSLISKDSASEMKESTAGPVETATAGSTEPAASFSEDSNAPTDPREKTQTDSTSSNVRTMNSEETGGMDFLESNLLASDMTLLDNILEDMTGSGSGNEASDLPPLHISEVISSFGELTDESNATVATNSPDNAVTTTLEGAACIQSGASDDDRNANARRQSPRLAPSASKSTPVSSLTDVSSPNMSGGSREASDNEDGSPPRKRRKVPTRTSLRTSTQVTFVPDKDVTGKSSPLKGKTRK